MLQIHCKFGKYYSTFEERRFLFTRFVSGLLPLLVVTRAFFNT
jgi:hypothetical protein